MCLIRPDWETLASLIERWEKWGIHVDHIDNFMVRGELTPSIYCSGGIDLYDVQIEYSNDTGDFESLCENYQNPEPSDIDIYEILNYNKIGWDGKPKYSEVSANLGKFHIFLHSMKYNSYHVIRSNWIVRKKDLIFCLQEVERLEAVLGYCKVENLSSEACEENKPRDQQKNNEITDGSSSVEIESHTGQYCVLNVSRNTGRPPQLDRKGKIGALGTLMLSALKHYYDVNRKQSKTLDGLMNHIKLAIADKENFPKYLEVIDKIKDDDKKFLLLKRGKWHTRYNVERDYKKRKKDLSVSNEELQGLS